MRSSPDWVISSRASNRGRFNDRAPGPAAAGEDTVCSVWKHAANTKDGTSISGGSNSTFEQFSDWSSRDNYDRAVVVSDLTAHSPTYGVALNPTPVSYVTVRNNGSSPVTINPGNTRSMLCVSTVWDCSTRTDTAYTLNGQQYWGYKEGTAGTLQKETKTFLVKADSTAVQTFAFDIDDI